MSRLRKGGKSTETTKSVPDHADEPSNCIICLERVSCRGKLSVCNHWFCFPCILEWAENTNTCPICKARFRCITKVHVSPFKSPPTKVRVGDKDQRVWNDDDDLVAEDVLGLIELDDFDDDYVPPNHVENPWTRSLLNRGRHQRRDVRRGLRQISRQQQLDQYDLEDSFIDDTDEALQAYLHSTYSRESVRINNDNNTNDDVVIDDDDDDEDDDEDDDDDDSDEEEDENYTVQRSEESVTQRGRSYALHNSPTSRTKSSRNTINSLISQSRLRSEQSCPSPASTSSFITSDDESDDDPNSDWVPFGCHKNSRNKGRNSVKTKKQESKKTSSSKQSAGPSSKQSKPSQRCKKQDPNQRRNNSKRKRQQTSISDDEFQAEASNNPSVNGWISMADKRTKAHASSSSYPRTRGKVSTNKQTRNTRSKGKKPVENIHVESSSNSDEEVLRDQTNIQKQPHRSASYTTRDAGNKSVDKYSSRLKPSHIEIIHEDTPSQSSENEDNLSDAVVVQPTPCSKATRSIFTKRRHRSPNATFDHSEDTKALSLSRSKTQRKCGASNLIDRTKNTETAFAHKSDLQIELSPLLKVKKQKRKRVMSFSSESD